MRQKSGPQTSTAEKTIKDIRRATRKHHSAEDKIRVVLEGLRGEDCPSSNDLRLLGLWKNGVSGSVCGLI